jgi:hypothetical protein
MVFGRSEDRCSCRPWSKVPCVVQDTPAQDLWLPLVGAVVGRLVVSMQGVRLQLNLRSEPANIPASTTNSIAFFYVVDYPLGRCLADVACPLLCTRCSLVLSVSAGIYVNHFYTHRGLKPTSMWEATREKIDRCCATACSTRVSFTVS